MQGLEELQKIIDETRRLVFFGGAGVSTPSGIPDFRSGKGLYSQCFQDEFGDLTPEMMLSSSFFWLETETFYRFYRRYMLYPDARPNAAHRKLYLMEKADKLRGIVTQNVDGLHKAAGNIRVYELHGSVQENSCVDCCATYDAEWMRTCTDKIPRCPHCGGIIRPGIVLYGEALNPYVIMGASREICEADTLLVAGTSLQVEPAASLAERFRGRHLIVVNREPTRMDEAASLVLHEDIAEVMDAIRVDLV